MTATPILVSIESILTRILSVVVVVVAVVAIAAVVQTVGLTVGSQREYGFDRSILRDSNQPSSRSISLCLCAKRSVGEPSKSHDNQLSNLNNPNN